MPSSATPSRSSATNTSAATPRYHPYARPVASTSTLAPTRSISSTPRMPRASTSNAVPHRTQELRLPTPGPQRTACPSQLPSDKPLRGTPPSRPRSKSTKKSERAPSPQPEVLINDVLLTREGALAVIRGLLLDMTGLEPLTKAEIAPLKKRSVAWLSPAGEETFMSANAQDDIVELVVENRLYWDPILRAPNTFLRLFDDPQSHYNTPLDTVNRKEFKEPRRITFGTISKGEHLPVSFLSCRLGTAALQNPLELVFEVLDIKLFKFCFRWGDQDEIRLIPSEPVREPGRKMTRAHLAFLIATEYHGRIEADYILNGGKEGEVSFSRLKILDLCEDPTTKIWYPTIVVGYPRHIS